MPSITYWNRLEPRPRTTDLAEPLAARVRDPAWLLTRQWQLGEFQGEDAASPAYLRIEAKVAGVAAWSAGGGPPQAIAAGAPLERAVTSEPSSRDDLARAVELGQTFDRILDELAAADLRPFFRAAYPVVDRPESDPRTTRFRAIWRGRATDGLALWQASTLASPPAPPGTPGGSAIPPPGVPWSVPAARHTVAAQAVQRLVAWIATTTGLPSNADPAGWRSAQLDYDVRVFTGLPTTGKAALAATPDRRGDLAWHAFDHTGETVPGSVATPPVTTIRRAVIPGHVRFRGMPNERFWDFEDARVDVAAIRPDRRNLASMLLVDFMLVHGNDWYLVPFEQPVGTVCASTLTMVDVFGGSTAIPRADANAPSAGRFSLFSTARTDGGVTDYFLVPSTAAVSVLESAPLEQVRFLRDDTANLAWAVEHATETPLGRAQLGADRAPPAVEADPTSDQPLRFRIQSPVPSHWFPLQPVKLTGTDQISLERAALLPLAGGSASMPVPRGKLLAPPVTPYRVREEELPREGTRVSRVVRRARGTDGSTQVWIARTRALGTGEGWSGLRFDLAATTRSVPE